MTSNTPKEPDKKTSPMIEAIKAFWAPILAVLGAIMLGVEFLDTLQTKSTLILYVFIYALFGSALIFFYLLVSQRQRFNNKQRVTFVFLIIVALFFAFWLKGQTIHQTDYFVLDISENTTGSFQELKAKLGLILTTESIPNNNDIGLVVFGGETKGNSGCSDIEELIPPSPKEESTPVVSAVIDSLENIKMSGPGNIQGAVLFALNKLKGRPGIQRIVLITSAVDERCNRLNRNALDKFAEENNINFELFAITVKMSETDRMILTQYATNQALINVESLSELPEAAEFVVQSRPASHDIYYFGYYGYMPTFNK